MVSIATAMKAIRLQPVSIAPAMKAIRLLSASIAMKAIRLQPVSIAMASIMLATSSCDDAFMDESPQTNITVPGYFNTVNDLEVYTNGFYYGHMPSFAIIDADSDNVTGRGHTGTDETWNVVFGNLSIDNVIDSLWSIAWNRLKDVNVFLDNADRAQGDAERIAHFKGIARYSRAHIYINMVKRYSHVPWIEHAIASDDPDVYRASDTRAFVADKIMDDLEYAAANISDKTGNKTRVHKYCALALLSRFALYEGTFRKYHPELNLAATANRFLERAVSASEAVMGSGLFDIATTSVEAIGDGMTGSPAFRNLFASFKLDGNAEVIQWVEFPDNLLSSGSINPEHFSLSRGLQESFLTYPEGKPFATVSGYATMPYYEVFKNRDPRLAETFCHPGSVTWYKDRATPAAYDNPPSKGGYLQEKFEANRQSSSQSHYEGRAIFRYAEVLLNYAEAKAELGAFGAEESAITIDKLRARVGMPAFDAVRETDAALRAQYPGVGDVVAAVRRERRVELACEGFRQTDLYRWGVGNRYKDVEARQGIWVPGFGAYDSSGDGIPDYAIVRRESDIPADWGNVAIHGVKRWFYFEDDASMVRGEAVTTFELSEGTRGYIMNKEAGSRDFRSPGDYYRPINVTHLVLNPNLKQPPGW